MEQNFEKWFGHIVDIEGGFSDDPKDPGNWTGGRCGEGELKGTKFGISAAAYPNLDIRALTVAGVKPFYHSYWHEAHCDALPAPLDGFVFDCSINCGPRTAIVILQRALKLKTDGIFGPHTERAGITATREQMAMFMVERDFHYAREPSFRRFGPGWLKRLFLDAMFSTEDQ